MGSVMEIQLINEKYYFVMKTMQVFLWTVVLCLLGTWVQAQPFYFLHNYGASVSSPTTEDFGQDGHRRFQNSAGMMVSGISQGSGPQRIAFAVTDEFGQVPAPNFENYYYTQSGLVRMYIFNSHCAEINTKEFALGGVCALAPYLSERFYFAELNFSGGVVASKFFSLGPDYHQSKIHEMVTEPTGQYVYMMGETRHISTQRNLIFVVKLRYDGVIMWSRLYDLDSGPYNQEKAYDGVELPGGQEFAVVGSTINQAGTRSAGYIFRLNATTGLPAPQPFLRIENGTESFVATSIEWTNNPILPSGGGFIVGGWGVYAGGYEAGAMLVDQASGGTWGIGNIYVGQSSNGTSYTYDVSARQNSKEGQEYYLTGTMESGYFGGNDVQAWRLDYLMNPIGDFIYGTAGNDESNAIDVRNNADDGLSIFGTSDKSNGSNDMLILNAYMNGVAPCNFYEDVPSIATPLVLRHGFMFSPPLPHTLTITNDIFALDVPMPDNQLCGQYPIPGGDNNKTAPSNLDDANVLRLLGNPNDGYAIQIKHTATGAEQLNVSLCDMNGRVLKSTQFEIQSGANMLDLGIVNEEVTAGVYIVRWNSSHYTGAKKIVLQPSR